MANSNGFPIRLPNFEDADEVVAWQESVVQRLDFLISQGLQTGTGGSATIVNLALQEEKVYCLESWVLGVLVETTGTSVPGLTMLNVFRGGFKLDGSGNAQAIGGGVSKVIGSVNQGETSEPWSAAMSVSGNAVLQTVTGNANDLIQWRCRMKLFDVGI